MGRQEYHRVKHLSQQREVSPKKGRAENARPLRIQYLAAAVLSDLGSALITELGAGFQLMLAVRAFGGRLGSAAFTTELRTGRQFGAALNAFGCCTRSAG